MKTAMKIAIVALVLVGFGMIMTGCNTVAGAGKDTKAAGQSIENAANNNK